MFGIGQGDFIVVFDLNRYYIVERVNIVVVNLDVCGLYIDIWIIGDVVKEFFLDFFEQYYVLDVYNRIIEVFEFGNKDLFKMCWKIVQEYFGFDVDLYKVYESDKKFFVFGIGYCYIDSCWFWLFDEIKCKVV